MVAAASGAGGQPSTNASSRKPLPELEMKKQECLAGCKQSCAKGSCSREPVQKKRLHQLWNGPWKFRASGHERASDKSLCWRRTSETQFKKNEKNSKNSKNPIFSLKLPKTKQKKSKKLNTTQDPSGGLAHQSNVNIPIVLSLKNLSLIFVLSFAFVPSAPCTIDVSVRAAGFEGCPERGVCVFAFAHLGFSPTLEFAHTRCAQFLRAALPSVLVHLALNKCLFAATPACRSFEDHQPVPPSLPAETATTGAASDRGVASPRSPVSCVTSPCNTLGLKWTRPLGPSSLQSRGSLARTLRSGGFRRAGARTCSGCAHLTPARLATAS